MSDRAKMLQSGIVLLGEAEVTAIVGRLFGHCKPEMKQLGIPDIRNVGSRNDLRSESLDKTEQEIAAISDSIPISSEWKNDHLNGTFIPGASCGHEDSSDFPSESREDAAVVLARNFQRSEWKSSCLDGSDNPSDSDTTSNILSVDSTGSPISSENQEEVAAVPARIFSCGEQDDVTQADDSCGATTAEDTSCQTEEAESKDSRCTSSTMSEEVSLGSLASEEAVAQATVSPDEGNRAGFATREVLAQETVIPNDEVINDTFDPKGLITKEMVEEDKQLHQEIVQEEEKLMEETLRREEAEGTSRERSFKQLQHLLSRSNFYAQFLMSKIEQQFQEPTESPASTGEREKMQECGRPERRSARISSKAANMKLQRLMNTDLRRSQRKRVQPRGNALHASGAKRRHYDSPYVEDENDESSDEGKDGAVPADETACDIHEQPSLMSGGVLWPYQLEGFKWLKVLYENGINGILADEMGLGKTVQCIALLAHLVEMGVSGPFLICAPLSTLSNWVMEFNRFAPKIPVILYHGLQQVRQDLRQRITQANVTGRRPTRPVVVTSYEIAMRDCRFLQHFKWRYLIVDEGHRIKNFQCQLVRELKKYSSANRLLLTGTPLQNNLSELWSLLNFLLPEIFDDLQVFESWFDVGILSRSKGDLVAQEQEKQIINTMHQILSPFLLRRTKAEVPLNLPPKKELLVYAPMSDLQQQFYKALADRSILSLLNKRQGKLEEAINFEESGRGKRNIKRLNYCELDVSKSGDDLPFHSTEQTGGKPEATKTAAAPGVEINVTVRGIMSQLRKVCDHPYLIEYPLDPVTNDYKINEDLVRASGKLRVLDCLVAGLKKLNHKVLIFSQMTLMLDILQDYCNLRRYYFNRLDGKMKIEDRTHEIADFNKNPKSFLFLISTRAGGLGLNLTAADTVIIYDSDWNPQCDLQAQDRCHRIGQTKPVVVYRLVSANTIDEKIVERAAMKRKLEKMIIRKGRFHNARESLGKKQMFTVEDLVELLQCSDHQGVVRSREGKVLTKQELDMLLDRSHMTGEKEAGESGPGRPEEVKGLYKLVDSEQATQLKFDTPET